MTRKTIIWSTLIIFGMVTLAATAWAEDIKTRMHNRLPAIVKLKDQGVVGENYQGYLTILKAAADKQAVIDAENQDRGIIYRAIAKKQGTTPDLVGRRRALQIFEKAAPGTMVQGQDGKWIKK
jgi:uncharacterized protein YdbL (DUF1318 family)